MRLPKYAVFLYLCGGLIAFALAFLLLNHTHLLYKIYYRWAAAGDVSNALFNALGFTLQGMGWLLVLYFLPRWALLILTVPIVLSAFVNIAYQRILGEYLNANTMSWLLSETGQAGAALQQFAGDFIIALLYVAILMLLLLTSRWSLRCVWPVTHEKFAPWVLVLALSSCELLRALGFPLGNELNIYSLAARSWLEQPPLRQPPSAKPVSPPQVDKIIWLIDESVAASSAQQVLADEIKKHQALDFGEIQSVSNCSATTNAALRWGVNVPNLKPNSDLRTQPTIWAYAKAAGFRTYLFDGQTNTPQNLLWPAELKLIDEYRPMNQGIQSDLNIANQLNPLLKKPGRNFVYVVLRGAHYAYENNYPKNFLPAKATLAQRYQAAIQYSKKDFFNTLLHEVDRQRVFIVYTSDHGQHLSGGVPHCTKKPHPDEFRVPFLVFTSPKISDQFAKTPLTGRSQTQIFPSSLWLMGYDAAYAERNYDHLLWQSTVKPLWFGHSLLPDAETGLLEVKQH